jgi:hypothetical protein
MSGKPIVVDGSNLAFVEPTSEGKPRMSNLVAVSKALRGEGYDPQVVVDASLVHQVDDPDQLDALIDTGRIHQAPAGTDADGFVLQLADELDADVVSNDWFDPWREQYPWIPQRRRPLMIVDGNVLFEAEASDEDRGR